MAKKRRKAAHKSGQNRPKAPRSEAQIAAAQANIVKAREVRDAQRASAEPAHDPAPHPADANRPRAFFTLGEKSERKRAKAEKHDAQAEAKPDPRALSAAEASSFREKLIEILVSGWELADKGLTLTALLDGEEAYIWRSIDDEDTAFLADRIIAKGRANAFVGEQVRALVDHWQDARMTLILLPRVLESAGWWQARGLKLAFLGVEVPPKAQRPRRQRASANGHHAGQPGATQPYQPTGTEGAMYGAQ